MGIDEEIDIIGKASKLINSKSLPSEIDLDLKVDKPISKKEYIKTIGGPPSRRRQRVVKKIAIPKGKNGFVKLKVTEL